jgi:TRAP-type C4-dicarboxylate transport system permease small subunit
MWLKKVGETIGKVAAPFSRAINYGGGFFLLVLMVLVVVHVAGRYFLNRPVPGAFELIELLMTFVVFLGFGYCALQRGNVSVDLFVGLLPQRAQEVIDAATCLLSIGVVTLITWQGVVQMLSLWESGHVSGVLHIPHYPFLFVLVVGCAAFDLILLVNFFEHLYGVFRK